MKCDEERTVVIYGAGQGGCMLRNLLDSRYVVVGFCDEDRNKQGMRIDNIPVYSPEEAMQLQPDIVWISLIDTSRTNQIAAHLATLQFKGDIRKIHELNSDYNIRLAELRLLAEYIRENDIKGDAAELGVFRGDFAKEINREFADRKIWLFDTFEGFDPADLKKDLALGITHYNDFTDTSEELVISRLATPENAVIRKGRFPDTIPEEDTEFAFVSLDADLEEPTYEGLEYFYPRLSAGGVIMIHDFRSRQYPGVGKAVRKYCRQHGIKWVPLCDIHGTAIIVKTITPDCS